jgi:hypothetical protein
MMMRSNFALGLGAVIVFVIVAFLMLQFMPQPLDNMSYLVIGSVATLVSMLVLFFTLIMTRMKSTDTFFKRRRKGS